MHPMHAVLETKWNETGNVKCVCDLVAQCVRSPLPPSPLFQSVAPERYENFVRNFPPGRLPSRLSGYRLSPANWNMIEMLIIPDRRAGCRTDARHRDGSGCARLRMGRRDRGRCDRGGHRSSSSGGLIQPRTHPGRA